MKAYSYDLRLRVLRAVDQGRPRAEIVTMFALSLATLKRYLKRERETGDVRVKPIPGRPAKKGAALLARLQPQLDTSPDATLEEHCQIWETTQGVQVSTASMSRAIQRLNWTRKKKTLRASEQKEADRAAWREQTQTLDAGKLVFVDECGSNIALTRLYARSPKGGCTVQFHATEEPILLSWLRSRSKEWAKRSSLKGLRIVPFLRSTWNRFLYRACKRDKSWSWII